MSKVLGIIGRGQLGMMLTEAAQNMKEEISKIIVLDPTENCPASKVGAEQIIADFKDKNAIKSMIEVTTHDYYTYTHSVDVSTYALAFGDYLGLNEVQLKALGKGAMLHDLGKKRVPLEILNKKGKLTEDEFTVMKNHPSLGIDILKEMGEENEITFAIIEQHHEKLSGQGYPKGLKGDEIHPFAQIVALCDIFNALTTKRSYKKAMSSFDAFKIMHQHMKHELNLKLLSKFIKFMGDVE